MKLWAGRTGGDVDERLSAINNSIGFDSRMVKQDITGSIAHARMLGKVGIIDEADAAAIVAGLKGILADIESGALEIDMSCEDIHTFVEATLTERIGDAGKRLHTARSRNDQVALDIRMYLADAIDRLIGLAKDLAAAFCDVAEQHLETVMPGYTHLQRAQPITLAHWLMAYAQMLLRDIERLADCKKRTLILPLGSGALAGTTYPLDREYVAEQLGFNGISLNSLDGVSDRDFALELLGDLSILMMHLSRFSEEICLWCSWEFKFVTLADQFSTGSSIMPQKKNPDITELVRGKTGRVYGDLMTLLTAMKALPLAYNKDMQEDKEALFDAIDTAELSLSVLAPMLRTATFHPANMKKAAAAGLHQRHRLRGLHGEEGRALPGRLQGDRPAGEVLHRPGADPGRAAHRRVPPVQPGVRRGRVPGHRPADLRQPAQPARRPRAGGREGHDRRRRGRGI